MAGSRASKSSPGNPQIHNPNQMLWKDKTRNKSLIRIFSVNHKILLGFGIIAFATALFIIYAVINPMEKPKKPRVIIPLPAPKLMDLPMFQGEHRESLYWGTYRPQVSFGVHARTPQSLVAGLMWLGVKNGMYSMRHVCQDSDELKQYGWTSHNGRDYGHQVLIEQTMTLTTSFLKSKDHGSGYGGDWAVRIRVQSDESLPDEATSNNAHLFFYVADEGGKSLTLGSGVLDIHGDSILASGSRSDIEDWQLHLFSETLSSGLDDYPRASHPNEDERHVDLRCWMHLAADSMHSIAELLKMDKDIQKEYSSTAKLLSDFELLNKMHVDTANGAYCDYGNHTEKVQLTWKIVETGNNYPRREFVREVLEKPVLQLVPHLGYVSLFPFILRLIPPDSWILESQLDLISNRSILWTDFGLRSLSKTSSMYM